MSCVVCTAILFADAGAEAAKYMLLDDRNVVETSATLVLGAVSLCDID